MGSTEVELPKQYRACVYDSPGTISTKVETLDMPEPSPGEVLIQLYVGSLAPMRCYGTPALMLRSFDRTHSGVCHSDLGIMENLVS